MNTPNRHFRLERINQFEDDADIFDDLLHLPPSALDHLAHADAWSIRQHVVHAVETEVIAFHRYRKAVAEPGSVIPGYDGEAWANSRHLLYGHEHLADWVDLFKVLRKISARHLRRILGSDWSAYSYVHEGHGPKDLPEWLEFYFLHVREHREYIDSALWAWKDQTSTV